MIITRTPFRMSYVGGGTDIATYYRREGGAVVSAAIDRYMYITLHRRFASGVRVAYSQTEEVDDIDHLKHPLVREAMRMTGIKDGIEITSTADIPAKGTGLGSSSSYTVGLLQALHAFQGKRLSAEDLAEMACDIEINKCGEPIGKQDQYAAAIGGMNLFKFNTDETVSVEPVFLSGGFKRELDESTLIFYTGKSRSASSILAEQTVNSGSDEKLPHLRRMTALAFQFRTAVESGNLMEIGELLKENWSLKKALAKGISNSLVDDMYDAGMSEGALGGKLLGAGAGGFIMFIAERAKHQKIIQKLSDFRSLNFKIEKQGAQVIYYG